MFHMHTSVSLRVEESKRIIGTARYTLNYKYGITNNSRSREVEMHKYAFIKDESRVSIRLIITCLMLCQWQK
jgi:hypothetical protein